MTLEQFQTAISDKIFVELQSDAVSQFTANPLGLNSFRSAADTAGVLVFLSSINKIYAKGHYYGGDFDSILTRVESLENAIQSLGTPLANLVSRVAQNETDIAANTSDIADALSRISSLETSLEDLNEGISHTVNDLVDTYLSNILNGESLADVLTEIQQELTLKAAQSDFSALVTKLGTNDWNVTNDGGTVVTVINNLKNTTQTLTTDLSALENTVSGIPRFEIQVVSANPITGYPDINIPSTSTIYLCVSPEDEQEGNDELYTEYIYINRNAGKFDEQDPPQPLEADYHWEKLGRQAFKMTKYLTEEDTVDLINQLGDTIEAKIQGLTGDKIAQITTNKDNITELQSTVSSIQSAIGYITNLFDNEGNILLTGEDIKTTSDEESNTIAEDISLLQNNKLDADSINWVIIGNE